MRAIINFFTSLLEDIDSKLINWKSKDNPYVSQLIIERNIYVAKHIELEKKYGKDGWKRQDFKNVKRWHEINCEIDKLHPVRYVDIRKVFTFLYHENYVKDFNTKEEWIRHEEEMIKEVEKILEEVVGGNNGI